MKTMEKLVEFFMDKRRNHKAGRKTLGNHYVIVYENGDADFVYHWTVIAAVRKDKTTIANQDKATITYGCWDTSSTNRACSSYAWELASRGFDVEDTRKPRKRK